MTEKDKLNPQEQAVKDYLDKQVNDDAALRALYVPAKIKDCFKYITEEARKKAVNGCAMIEDSLVFKWARDYYLEILPKEADKNVVEVVQKKAETTVKAEAEKTEEKKEPKVVHQLMFDFGD